MLEKEFIPYEQALELKELDFDELCFAWYISKKSGLEIGKVVKSNLIQDAVLAPTYSQAFRWFRENYGIYGIISPRFNNDNSIWYVSEEIDIAKNDIESLNKNLFRGIFEMYKTYKEAEMFCLNKLIEMVKNK